MQPDEARAWAETYSRIFAPGDFYVELQEQGIVERARRVADASSTASSRRSLRELGLPTVATNDIHYLTREDAKTQDLLLCIGTGSTVDQPGRMKFSCDEFYMKSADEMREAIGEYEEALANTLEIAEKCNVEMEFGKIILPKFEVPERRHRGRLPARAVPRRPEGALRRPGPA